MPPKSNPPSQDCQLASGRQQPVMESFQKSPSHGPEIMQGQNPSSEETSSRHFTASATGTTMKLLKQKTVVTAPPLRN